MRGIIALAFAICVMVSFGCAEDPELPGVGGDFGCEGEWSPVTEEHGYRLSDYIRGYGGFFFEIRWPQEENNQGEWVPVDHDRVEVEVDAGANLYRVYDFNMNKIESKAEEGLHYWATVLLEDEDDVYHVVIDTWTSDRSVRYRPCD